MTLLHWLGVVMLNGLITLALLISGLLYLVILLPAVLYLFYCEYRDEAVAAPPQRRTLY